MGLAACQAQVYFGLNAWLSLGMVGLAAHQTHICLWAQRLTELVGIGLSSYLDYFRKEDSGKNKTCWSISSSPNLYVFNTQRFWKFLSIVNESLFIFSIRFYVSHIDLLGSSRPSGLSLLEGGVWETKRWLSFNATIEWTSCDLWWHEKFSIW
jgi:hypothetical protein